MSLAQVATWHEVRTLPRLRPVAIGLLAALGMLTFYMGIITLAQGWAHALEQLADDRWFVGAIVAGVGTQIGLYTYLRDQHVRAATGSMVASSGTSAAAMLACCAHHLTDLLPLFGLSGAALFLTTYKAPLLWQAIMTNFVGIAYLLRKVCHQRRAVCHTSTVSAARADEKRFRG